MKNNTFLLIRYGLYYYVYADEPNWHKHNCLECFSYLYPAIEFIKSKNGTVKHGVWKYDYAPKR